MEESQLDFATSATIELTEALSAVAPDERDDLILAHIQKVSDEPSAVSIFDPNEKVEWVSGIKDTSLASYCAGRVSLLDFFTYCCINCQHVLPDLNDLESLYSVEDGLVVVGVHSAKFETERLSSNVLNAVQRLNVKHPVLNDPEAQLWSRLGIQCWPTLVLLNPNGKPILVLAGEGHREILFRVVSVAIKHFREIKMLKTGDNPGFKPNIISSSSITDLRFPGKVVENLFSTHADSEPWLAISDSGNNRILVIDIHNTIIHIVGGLEAKLKDGNFQQARFNNPQGMCWLDENTLIVCDTGNHLLRRITFDDQNVSVLAGTGVQGEFGDSGGLKYCQQSLSSPWDIVLYKTADMDMSIRKSLLVADEENIVPDIKIEPEAVRRVLLIACAGSHQIWALFLDTTVWWKYKTYAEGTVLPIVGSGREENRNNRYPNSAGLAQPSGLALNGENLYIADSESSTIRHLDLRSGQLSPFLGGDRNPINLFAFGDIDGKGYTAKLQHPLGVAFCFHTSSVFVADTYNHKIKIVDPSTGDCTTFYPTPDSAMFISEPGGLCVLSKMAQIIVVDTNNHRVVLIDQDYKTCEELKFMFLGDSDVKKKENNEFNKNNVLLHTEVLKVLHEHGSKIVLNLDCYTKLGDEDNEMHLTPAAPQSWSIKIFDLDLQNDLTHEWEIVGGVKSGKNLPARFEASRKDGLCELNVERTLRIEFFVSLCKEGLCFIKNFAVDCKLVTADDVEKIQIYNINVKLLPDGGMEIESEDI